MGTSKTTSGKALARLLSMQFLDVDALIEYELSLSISEIFSKCGEDFFRDYESKTVKKISGYDNCVIATGGGAVLKPENMRYLKQSGTVILLSATPEALFRRLKNSKKRPLLNGMTLESLTELYEGRKELYKKYADFEVFVDNLPTGAIMGKIIGFLRRTGRVTT
jgi:shikimate kinase